MGAKSKDEKKPPKKGKQAQEGPKRYQERMKKVARMLINIALAGQLEEFEKGWQDLKDVSRDLWNTIRSKSNSLEAQKRELGVELGKKRSELNKAKNKMKALEPLKRSVRDEEKKLSGLKRKKPKRSKKQRESERDTVDIDRNLTVDIDPDIDADIIGCEHPEAKWYVNISRYWSVVIVQIFITVLNIFAPLPEGWVRSGYSGEWSNPEGYVWAVTMTVLTMGSAILGAALTRDLPLDYKPEAAEIYQQAGVYDFWGRLGLRVRPSLRQSPGFFIPVFVPILLLIYHTSGQQFVQVVQRIDWTLLICLALVLGIALKLPFHFLLLGDIKNKIFIRHWFGLVFLLLSTAAEWHFIWGTVTCMGGEDYLHAGYEAAKAEILAELPDISRTFAEQWDEVQIGSVLDILFFIFSLIFLLILGVIALGMLLFTCIAAFVVLFMLATVFVWLVLLPQFGLVISRSVRADEFYVVFFKLGLSYMVMLLVNLAIEMFVWR